MENKIFVKANNDFKKYGKGILFNNGIALNETAAFIFEHCDGKQSVSNIVNSFAENYDADLNELSDDVYKSISEMIDIGIIVDVTSTKEA